MESHRNQLLFATCDHLYADDLQSYCSTSLSDFDLTVQLVNLTLSNIALGKRKFVFFQCLSLEAKIDFDA